MSREEKYSKPVPVRLDPDDYEELKAEAAATAIDLSALIRSNIKLYRAQLARQRGFRYVQADSTQSGATVHEEMLAAG